ncbi:MAG TPA: class I SAM-dependent methyltransferase [Candidatus Limnocylindria bacterium]|nr:class I SAM-dependent methyltransferase [Candidatus Limnocylindria bacterium]
MSDSLAPASAAALADWAARVAADRAQVERVREVEDPSDFYAQVAERFRLDPRRSEDATLELLLRDAHPEETWLDIGAGAGRYALPLALRVEHVIAVEPSPRMVELLRQGMREHRIGNVRVLEADWPLADPPPAEVGLMAHVGYDIANIGPFLDRLESASSRLCLAVMGESAMTTVASRLWEAIHGEARVRLPALPELLVLLLARGRLPEVQLVDRRPPVFSSADEALAMARRQLWLREGSVKDDRLRALLPDHLHEVDGGWTFDRWPSKIGIVSWRPH